MDGGEALQVEPINVAGHLSNLPADDGRVDGPRTRGVACEAHVQRQIEDDRDRQASVPVAQRDQVTALHPVDVRGIDHRQAAGSEASVEPFAKPGEGCIGGPLVALVPGHKAAHTVRGNDRVSVEVPRGEGGFPRARRTDQKNQRGWWEVDHEAAISERSTPASRRSAADFSVWPARASVTARRKDSIVAS